MYRFLIAATLVFTIALTASATPTNKQALSVHLGPYFLAKVNDCRLCHVPGDVELNEDKPRNPFGERLEAMEDELSRLGKPTDITARFEAIADEDADGDGIANLSEILAGHFPGDAMDKPTLSETHAVEKVVAKYRRFLTSYPWRPFVPVQRPAVPAGDDQLNSIDKFIAAGHREQELIPRPEADKATLMRRVYFDLVGLPPTPGEVHAFVTNTSPDSYEAVVDRLLGSPQYGERWGRHWMDVWRYSDWAGWSGGNDIRDSQPYVWRWRDWIIESLNSDKGYDRMILEMISGDELAPNDPQTLRATGYLARNFNSSREKWMIDTVDHVYMAFQGLTMRCARCHDHFYDPILQTEYYQARAVFEPYKIRIDPVPGEADTKKDGLARAFDEDLKVVTYLFQRGDERHPDTTKPIDPGVPRTLGLPFPSVEEMNLPWGKSTGRRLAFAQWLANTQNPLTARVAVNHIWARHFGQPLVPSVFDFGKNGRRPMAPALLDWLAAELMEHQWSMKHIHKLILMSRTYRQSSTPDASNLKLDNDNVYFWRMTPRRLEAEEVRDQILYVAGKLDLTAGGPDLDQNLGLTLFRRSIYFRHAHEKQMEYLKLFDAASVTECYQRKESILPQQALALANGPLSNDMALHIASEIQKEVGSDQEKFVSSAFPRMIGRPPTSAEIAECLNYLRANHPVEASQIPKSTEPNESHEQAQIDRGFIGLILVLFNHHEFITIR